MSILLIFFFVVILIEGVRLTQYNNEYISRDNSKQINGIFVFFVLISHMSGYIELSNKYDFLYITFKDFLLQLVVVTFLFYSGYGISESIKKKGIGYVKALPKRSLQLLFQFDLIVLLFVLLQLIRGKVYSFKHILLSLIGWNSVGNSNWYVFIVIAMYILTYISYMIIRNNQKNACLLNCVLSFAFMFLMMYLKNGETRWYNTFLCYNLGMLYSLYKERFEYYMKNYQFIYLGTLLLSLIVFLYCKSLRENIYFYHLHSWFFCIIIILISMKIKINSRILKFLGDHIFSIYMLQRIVMITLKDMGINQSIYLFIILSMILSLIIAYVFDKFYPHIKKLVFS